MSIIDAFDTSEPYITPDMRVSPVEEMASVSIVVFEKHNLRALLKGHEYREIASIDMGMGLPVYRIVYRGTPVNIFLSVQNGSAAAECLEILIAMGSRKFVYYGSCGVLDDKVTSEKILVPVAAYRDEGMSYHYLPASDYISVSGAEKTGRLLDRAGFPHRDVKAWTTDAIFRETRENTAKRKAEGCLVVEMECASIEAVSRFRNVQVCYFLYAEDSLGGPKWEKRTMGSMTGDVADRYALAALEMAVLM